MHVLKKITEVTTESNDRPVLLEMPVIADCGVESASGGRRRSRSPDSRSGSGSDSGSESSGERRRRRKEKKRLKKEKKKMKKAAKKAKKERSRSPEGTPRAVTPNAPMVTKWLTFQRKSKTQTWMRKAPGSAVVRLRKGLKMGSEAAAPKGLPGRRE